MSVQKKPYQVCTKGIWDTTIPGITFDENGVSNYCRFQELMMDAYPQGDKGRTDWEALVEQMKKKGRGRRYDCLVGVSGGVDSSNLLVLMKEYGLRPLAVNLDNGFSSEIAVQNIYKLTRALDIDLETYVIDYEEMKDLLYAYMRAGIPWIDSPTDGAIKAVMYKTALKENVKFIIRGNDFRSEGKQPEEWTSGADVTHIHKKFGRGVRLKTYPRLSIAGIFYAGFVRKIIDIRPYYYLAYKKQDAKKRLQDRFGWQDYGGHHHENLFTKFVMAYWLPKKFGIDKRRINLSAQVLSKAITRDQALALIEKPFGTEEDLSALKNYVLKKLDISADEFRDIWNAPNRKAADFPANDRFVYKTVKYAGPVINRIYAFVPMSVMAHEFFKKDRG